MLKLAPLALGLLTLLSIAPNARAAIANANLQPVRQPAADLHAQVIMKGGGQPEQRREQPEQRQSQPEQRREQPEARREPERLHRAGFERERFSERRHREYNSRRRHRPEEFRGPQHREYRHDR
jgi:hypothetical protein